MNHTIDHNLAASYAFAFEQGYKRAMVDCGKLSPDLSQRKAHKLYKAAKVRAWVKAGLVKPIKVGDGINSKITYSRQELEIANRSTL